MDDWTFKGFAENFDAHVHGQLPWYDMVSEATAFIAKNYIPTSGTVYDIGCSTGNITEKLLPTIEARGGNIVGIDIEPSMIKKYNEKFKDYSCFVSSEQECAEGYDYLEFDVAIVFLTMMFVEVYEQENLIIIV